MNPPPFSPSPALLERAVALAGTPVYLYDEATIIDRCRRVRAMPNAFGLRVAYAMKANSNRAILQLVTGQGLGIDASSLNEVRRARLAGVADQRIMLTTQEVPEGDDREELEQLMAAGLEYNVCSLRQLELLARSATTEQCAISIRVNPGVGTGESRTRNTGDKYSSFGIHLDALPEVVRRARAHRMPIVEVHTHIGSGGAPELWQSNIDRVLTIVEQFFPEATTVNLGGGFRVARMPDESSADITALGRYAERRFSEFSARTGRKLKMAVEPGTYLVANAGVIVSRVLDKKSSGPDGFDFLILDAGMETNTRPLLYGSRHPFSVVARDGRVLSDEFALPSQALLPQVVVGRCCETGDCQTLDEQHTVIPRRMAEPEIGDYVVIGGAGAYCSSMSLTGYNSHRQAPELLVRPDGSLVTIRERQSLAQLVMNERSLPEPA